MSAVFENKSMAGYQIGASHSNKWLVTLLSLAFSGYTAVHLHDYALVMFVNQDTWLVKEVAIRVAAVGLAFFEIIVGGVFVYLYRTTSGFNPALVLVGLVALVVASMAVVAGNGSQQSKADIKTNLVNAHYSSLAAIQNQINGAAMERDISLRQASQIKDPNQRAIEKDRANLEYNNRVARLNTQQAGMETNRPIQPIENGSVFHYVSITLFSVLCSFGALFLSGYSAAFLKPLVAIPAFTLIEKLRHAWQSDGSDFQTVKHEVSPIGGMIGAVIGTQKLSKKPLPSTSENTTTNNDSSGTSKNRPHALDSSSGRFNESSERPLNDKAQKGGKVAYSTSHYEAIKQGVIAGTIKPVQKPIKAALVTLKVRFVDDAARQKKAAEILDQLKQETVLIDNKDFGKGGKVVAKYLLNPNYQSEEGGADELGEYDLVTVCPHCNSINVTDVLKIEKRKGTIQCTDCKRGHVATSHQYDASQDYSDLLASAKTKQA